MLLAKSARLSGRVFVRALSIAAPKLPLHINGKHFCENQKRKKSETPQATIADIICCAYHAMQHSTTFVTYACTFQASGSKARPRSGLMCTILRPKRSCARYDSRSTHLQEYMPEMTDLYARFYTHRCPKVPMPRCRAPWTLHLRLSRHGAKFRVQTQNALNTTNSKHTRTTRTSNICTHKHKCTSLPIPLNKCCTD